MARVLILAGGCRGRRLAGALIASGNTVRITTRAEAGRAAIEEIGAECWVGTPDRLATLRGALDSVTVACWLLGTASGPADRLAALHTTRLELFLTQAVDTTVRALVYEASGEGRPAAARDEGARIVERVSARNEIPVAWLREDPRLGDAWHEAALRLVESFLAPQR